MSGGFSAFAGPLLGGPKELQFAGHIIIGGVASRLGGDKFSNGAITAAFQYLFNEIGNCYQRGYCSEEKNNSKIIRYNAAEPRTVPPTGENFEALYCTASCLQAETGNKDILVTGGQEVSGHGANSLHYENQAVDIASRRSNPGLTDKNVNYCAANCGYLYGQYEAFTYDPDRNHCHLQLLSGESSLRNRVDSIVRYRLWPH
jgi:hypothetical protein